MVRTALVLMASREDCVSPASKRPVKTVESSCFGLVLSKTLLNDLNQSEILASVSLTGLGQVFAIHDHCSWVAQEQNNDDLEKVSILNLESQS